MGKVAIVAQEKQKFTPVFSEAFIEFQLKDYEIRQQELNFKKSQSEKILSSLRKPSGLIQKI